MEHCFTGPVCSRCAGTSDVYMRSLNTCNLMVAAGGVASHLQHRHLRRRQLGALSTNSRCLHKGLAGAVDAELTTCLQTQHR